MLKQDILFGSGRGTSQKDRFPRSLDSSIVEVDGRRFEDLFQMFVDMSAEVGYYGYDSKSPSGNWKEFFKEVTDVNGKFDPAKFAELELSGEMPAHLSLMAAFLKMYDLERQNLNLLPARHLDYFYRDILGFSQKEGISGIVPVCIELNKNTKSAVIPSGTRFVAGKDTEGRVMTYKSAEDFVAYPAKVETIHSVEMDSDIFPLFGREFALPSLMHRGEKVVIHLKSSDVLSYLSVDYTTDTGWSKCQITGSTIELSGILPAPYNESVHHANINTEWPVIRFTVASCLAGQLSDVVIQKVEIINSTAFHFRSSRFGDVQNVAGALPFGPAPMTGDKSSIILSSIKGCKSVSIDSCDWKSSSFNMSGDCLILLNDCGQDSYLKGLIKFSSDPVNNKFPDKPVIPTLSEPAKISYSVTISEADGTDIFAFSPFGVMAGQDIPDEIKDDSYCQHIYIGLSDAQPDTSISMLLSVKHSTKFEPRNNPPKWSILSGNRWKDVIPVKDSTDNLIKNGIVKFDLSDYAMFEPHSIMPAEKLWIRVSLPVGVGKVEIETAVSQALELVPDVHSAGQLQKGFPLASASITKSLASIPGVKKVCQPLDGFSGSYDESEKDFQVRVSERLRHKNRCVSTWDYERILLEAFPSLSRVRCIHNHASIGSGQVEIVVVPKTHRKGDLEPVVTLDQKIEMEKLLSAKSSMFSKVSVSDPEYEPVDITCEINLLPGLTDVKEYAARTCDSLIAYLAPWSDGEQEINVDSCINESSILLFLERLPYVDYVRHLKVIIKGNQLLEGEDIRPSNAKAILTAGTMNIIVNMSVNG